MGDDEGVLRTALIGFLVVLLAGCSSKKSNEAPPPSSGSGSAAVTGGSGAGSGSAIAVKVVPLEWKTPSGERLLALRADGGLDGPCGPVGTVAGGEVKVGGQTLQWTGVERKGKNYKVAPLPWTITIGDGGVVTLVNEGHPDIALGKVTGTETEDGAQLFAALVIAAPTIQIALTFTPAAGGAPYELSGSADLDAWTIKQGGTVVATKKREDKPPEVKQPFAEAADGKVTAGGKLVGTISGRKPCGPHDKAVTALVETYLSRPR